jgi:methionine biosynthesis protein MetW
LDHQVILDLVSPGSSVLDLGCGSGDLLAALIARKNVRGQGIEIDEQAIYACVAKGLNVLHGDIDTGLSEYQARSFDYVILNESLQQVQHLETVLIDALRVGKYVIVGFPNFAYYPARLQLMFLGRSPITPALPYTWYESPNVHFFSLADFIGYCRKKHLTIHQKIFLGGKRHIRIFPNIFANIGIFLLTK